MKSTDTTFGAMIKLHSLVAAVRFLLVQKKKKNLYFFVALWMKIKTDDIKFRFHILEMNILTETS